MPNCLVKNFLLKKLSEIKKKKKNTMHLSPYDIYSPENYNINIAFYDTYANQSCTTTWLMILQYLSECI